MPAFKYICLGPLGYHLEKPYSEIVLKCVMMICCWYFTFLFVSCLQIFCNYSTDPKVGPSLILFPDFATIRLLDVYSFCLVLVNCVHVVFLLYILFLMITKVHVILPSLLYTVPDPLYMQESFDLTSPKFGSFCCFFWYKR